jgi:UDP-N-acetylmuramoyl-tripeptide--D-alanyl-D-alanine ligase
LGSDRIVRYLAAEIVALTGASTVQPLPAALPLRPTAAPATAGPGDLVFAMRPGDLNLAALARAGVAGVVLFPGERGPAKGSLGVLRAGSPALAFYKLAAESRSRCGTTLVAGITGSAGKSSTKEFLKAIVATRFRVTATAGSLNRISDCAQLLVGLEGAPGEAAVIEMGFGWAGDVEKMAAMARPNAGIITKVTADHLDGAGGSWERVVQEKGRLGYHIGPDGVLVIHAEDPGCALLPRSDYRCRVLTFGPSPGADALFTDVSAGEAGTSFTLHMGGQILPVQLGVFGAVQAANAAAAALAAHALGFTDAEITAGLAGARPLPRRFAIHRFEGNLTVIDDTFSANVDAMIQGLTNAASLAGGRRKLALLSGIAQLEGRTAELLRQVGRHVAQLGYADLFLVRPDERTAAIKAGAVAAGMAAERIHAVPSVSEIAPAVLPFMEPDTLLYAKISQYLWAGAQIDALLQAIPGRGLGPVT